MNKYSLKIINFINKIKITNNNSNIDLDLTKKINTKHNLILKIKEIMKRVFISKTINFNKEKYNLGKLHSDKFPIMYLFFRGIFKVN
jgi:hypothetical protein